jgi:hypothetical protein
LSSRSSAKPISRVVSHSRSRGLHRVLLMPEPQVSTAKVIIGLRANTIKRWQERITQQSAHADAQGINDHQGIEEVQRKLAEARDTARVFAMAPAWLQTPAIHTQWQPRMEDNTAERSSSICIRFRQKPGKSEESILQRQRALQGALKMVNEIQDKCWQQPWQTPFKRSEIELSCYRRKERD